VIAPALPRWFAAVLAEAETGVNARRSEVPRAVQDTEPPSVVVYNAIDDAWIAAGAPLDPNEVTPQQWVLQVNVGEELQLAADPFRSGGDDTAIIVLHLSGVALGGNNAASLAAAHRLMRAARRCVVDAWRTIGQEGLLLEGQRFDLPSNMTLLTQEPKPGSGAVDLALVIPFQSTDTWALGATET
jgi:hypothetical protein